MILVRFVCQARFGKAGDVVAGFKQSGEIARTIAGENVRGTIHEISVVPEADAAETQLRTDLSAGVLLGLAANSLFGWCGWTRSSASPTVSIPCSSERRVTLTGWFTLVGGPNRWGTTRPKHTRVKFELPGSLGFAAG